MRKAKVIISLIFIVLTITVLISSCTGTGPITGQKPVLTDENKKALDALVEANEYITGYDFNTYENPALIIDYAKFSSVLKQGIEAVNKFTEKMDEVGKQLNDMGYPTVSCIMEYEGEMKDFARFDQGFIFFVESFMPLGVRVSVGNAWVQYVQIDKSGYFPAIIGLVANGTDKDYSNVYIEFNLLNDQGSVVGFTNDMIGILKSGQTWQFKCEIAVNANTFEFSKLTYY